MCVTVAGGQGRLKSKNFSGCLTSAILSNINALTQVNGLVKPENRKVGQGVFDLFAKVKVTYSIYPVRTFRAV